MNDNKVIILPNGRRQRMYRSYCYECGYDKGYIRKSRLNKLCHNCNAEKAKITGRNWAGKEKEVIKQIKKARSKQIINHSEKTKNKIALSNVKTKNKQRKENGIIKNTYTRKQIRERVNKLIRTRIRNFDRYKDTEDNIGSLDFSFKEFVAHFESLFQPGMTWDNYGYHNWHIDHIKPLSMFKFNSYGDEEFKRCWTLSNLQPLWAKDNLSKSNKYEE